MYFSEKEQAIIESFYKNISNLSKDDILTIIWENGEVKARFDTCFDDFDEVDENDEFTSFVFEKVELKGIPPIELSESNYFTINYHNFPKDILLNGVKIN